MKYLFPVLLTGLLLAQVPVAPHAASDAEPGSSAGPVYSFGVTPQFEQRKLHAIWKPIIDELTKRTGLRFKLVSALKVQEFEKVIERGELDFAYINPYHVVQVHESQGYGPLVADKAPLRGIIVVRKDSPIRKPADLHGKTVAFPSPNALGASLLTRSDLEQLYRAQVTPLYVKTHSSVYLHVAKNLVAGGGGVEKTLQEQDESLRAQLRVIYTTRACPSLPVVAHPRVPAPVQEKIRKALLAIGETPEGREMLLKVPVRQFVPVTWDDYAVMRGWGLEKYWQKVREGD